MMKDKVDGVVGPIKGKEHLTRRKLEVGDIVTSLEMNQPFNEKTELKPAGRFGQECWEAMSALEVPELVKWRKSSVFKCVIHLIKRRRFSDEFYYHLRPFVPVTARESIKDLPWGSKFAVKQGDLWLLSK